MGIKVLEYLLTNIYGDKIIKITTVAEEPVYTVLVETRIKQMTLPELTSLNDYLIRFGYMINKIVVNENKALDMLIIYGHGIKEIATSEKVNEVAELASEEGIEKEREKENKEDNDKGFGDYIFDMLGSIM